MDMVKPIPPRSPTPIRCFHFSSDGKVPIPKITAVKPKKKIPNGLPIVRAVTIPRLRGWLNEVCQSLLIMIHVLAKANSGKIKNATGFLRELCKINEGGFKNPFPKRKAKAV